MKKSKYEILSKLKKIKKNKLVSSLGTLNREKNKIKRISIELKEMLDDSRLSIGETFNSSSPNKFLFQKKLTGKISFQK